jgi:predicted DNA-binding transcriptional regulator AlpA
MSTPTQIQERQHPVPSGLESEIRLTCEQVCAITGFSKSMLYREIREGRFPGPERRGPRWSRWRAGSVVEALNRWS